MVTTVWTPTPESEVEALPESAFKHDSATKAFQNTAQHRGRITQVELELRPLFLLSVRLFDGSFIAE